MAGELSREEIERLQSRLRSEGVCMTCVLRAPAPDGCSDCLNTGYERGEVARLASARQEGYREGVEAAAQWCRVRAYCAAIREREATDEQSRRAALLVKQTLDHAADVLPALSPAPAEPATPVAPDERRALNAEVQDYMIACGQHAEARRVAEERIATLEAENAALQERNAALEDGLRPFAKLGELFPPREPGSYEECIYCPAAGPEYAIGGDHLRRACALLQEDPDVE